MTPDSIEGETASAPSEESRPSDHEPEALSGRAGSGLTPAFLAGAGTGLSLTFPAGGEMLMKVPIGGSYPRILVINYREPIGSN